MCSTVYILRKKEKKKIGLRIIKKNIFFLYGQTSLLIERLNIFCIRCVQEEQRPVEKGKQEKVLAAPDITQVSPPAGKLLAAVCICLP